MEAGCFQVRFELREMDVGEGRDGFEFEDHQDARDEIEAMDADFLSLEKNVDFLLLLERDSAVPQSDFHCSLINPFNESRPEAPL